MPSAISRRALFGRILGGPAQLRPPWAYPDHVFTESCSHCGACIEACPERILTLGHAGYPIVDFKHGACTFCGACRDACPEHCFESGEVKRPWDLEASVQPSCLESKGIACRMCEAACEHSALRFRPRIGGGSSATIDRESCTGCGSCLAHCPFGAIVIQRPSRPEAQS